MHLFWEPPSAIGFEATAKKKRTSGWTPQTPAVPPSPCGEYRGGTRDVIRWGTPGVFIFCYFIDLLSSYSFRIIPFIVYLPVASDEITTRFLYLSGITFTFFG